MTLGNLLVQTLLLQQPKINSIFKINNLIHGYHTKIYYHIVTNPIMFKLLTTEPNHKGVNRIIITDLVYSCMTVRDS